MGPCLAGTLALGCMAHVESDASESQQELTAAPDVHASIRRVGTLVGVEVTADELAKPTSMPPVLIIGDAAFGRSRHPSDGQRDTRIFMIDAAEFDALPDDAEMTVGHLSPTARLEESAKGASPRIRPHQVQSVRKRIGALRNDKQDVVP